MPHPTPSQGHPQKMPLASSFVLLITLLTLLLSACNSSQAEQQANKSKTELDRQIAHARSTGVSASLLQPILHQQNKLSQASAPPTLFSSQPTTDHYQNLATRYHMLTVQVRGLEEQAMQKFGYQAVQNMKDFQTILAQRQNQGFIEAPTFAHFYNTYSKQMLKARYPKDYATISDKAQDATQSLRLLGVAFDKLTTFQGLIKLLKNSNMDTSALNQQVDRDIELLRSATTASDFSKVITLLDAQLQATVTFSTQAIPYVGAIKLKEFSDSIKTMQQYGGDTSTLQQDLQTDRAMLKNAKTFGDYLKFSSQIDSDLNAIRILLWKTKANFFVQNYHKQVTAWRQANVYHNPFDGQDYQLGNAYDALPEDFGEGSTIDNALDSAQTADDYQAVIDLVQNIEANFKAMQADYAASTPWDQPHDSDKQLMDYYKVTSGKVVIVSLTDQAARIYQDGQLIHSTQVVTGQYTRPTPPGFTHVFRKQHPVKFTSFDPPGSPLYFEPIMLEYGLEFRNGGYFLHDAYWRGVFGNGPDHRANLPHADPIDQKAGGNGSHGCINFSPDEAAWLYQNIDYGTPVIVY